MTTTPLMRTDAAADTTASSLPGIWRREVGAVALGFVVLELAMSARYGFHRDELYFLACARHLSWGYVDQPPFVPTVGWIAAHLFGTSPTSLRIFPALAGGAAVVLSALMARELGGRRKAQFLAALAAATSPQVLAACHLLSTAAFDMFFWAALCFLWLRLLRTGEQRLWLVIGAVTGLALLNKLNVVFLLVGLIAGVLAAGRGQVLLNRRAALGAIVALVIWSPNIVWNAQHDWAVLSMLRSLHQENSSLGASIGFIPSQLIVVGPVLIVLWLAGLRYLLASSFAKPIGLAYGVVVVLFTLSGAKPYYLAGMYFVLFAAGGVWAERRLERREPAKGVRGWTLMMAAGGVAALPLVLPVLPQSTLPAGSWEGTINKDLSATVGWHDFVHQIAGVSKTLRANERANLVVFTGDYGAAGAIDLWGAQYGLPHATSGHNTYWWWGPPEPRNGTTTIAVDVPRPYLLTIFSEVTAAGSVHTPGGVWTEERGDPIWICRGQTKTWTQAWSAARHYG